MVLRLLSAVLPDSEHGLQASVVVTSVVMASALVARVVMPSALVASASVVVASTLVAPSGRGLSGCGCGLNGRAFSFSGLSSRGLRLQNMDLLAVGHRLSCFSMCGILPGIEPTSALAGRFLTTGPPGMLL